MHPRPLPYGGRRKSSDARWTVENHTKHRLKSGGQTKRNRAVLDCEGGERSRAVRVARNAASERARAPLPPLPPFARPLAQRPQRSLREVSKRFLPGQPTFIPRRYSRGWSHKSSAAILIRLLTNRYGTHARRLSCANAVDTHPPLPHPRDNVGLRAVSSPTLSWGVGGFGFCAHGAGTIGAKSGSLRQNGGNVRFVPMASVRLVSEFPHRRGWGCAALMRPPGWSHKSSAAILI